MPTIFNRGDRVRWEIMARGENATGVVKARRSDDLSHSPDSYIYSVKLDQPYAIEPGELIDEIVARGCELRPISLIDVVRGFCTPANTLDALSDIVDAVDAARLLLDFDSQICNGGVEQWVDNRGSDFDRVCEILELINHADATECRDRLYEIDDYLVSDKNGVRECPKNRTHFDDECDLFDRWYYGTTLRQTFDRYVYRRLLLAK